MKREPLVLAFACIFPMLVAWLYFVVVSPSSDLPPAPNPLMQGLYAAGKVIQFGLPVAWIALQERSEFRFSRLRAGGVRAGILFGLIAATFAFAFYFAVWSGSGFLLGVPERIRGKLSEFGLATTAGYALFAAALSVVNSLLEEYYWRWFVFGRLRKYMTVSAAMIVSSFAFMGHHVIVLDIYFPNRFWDVAAPFSLAIAAGGMVWARLFHATGSLLGPWISHLIVDITIMVIGYDLAFRH